MQQENTASHSDGIKHGTAYGYKKCKPPKCKKCKDYNNRIAKERRARVRKEFLENPELFKGLHGRIYFAKESRCPCIKCRLIVNATNEEYRSKRLADVADGIIEIPKDVHGTPQGYNYWYCRCDDCKAAKSIYKDLLEAQKENK